MRSQCARVVGLRLPAPRSSSNGCGLKLDPGKGVPAARPGGRDSTPYRRDQETIPSESQAVVELIRKGLSTPDRLDVVAAAGDVSDAGGVPPPNCASAAP
jgi:hypothetical protein